MVRVDGGPRSPQVFDQRCHELAQLTAAVPPQLPRLVAAVGADGLVLRREAAVGTVALGAGGYWLPMPERGGNVSGCTPPGAISHWLTSA